MHRIVVYKNERKPLKTKLEGNAKTGEKSVTLVTIRLIILTTEGTFRN